MTNTEQMILDNATATDVIDRCERDLGRKLSSGEKRDLLTDNLDSWNRDRIIATVARLI